MWRGCQASPERRVPLGRVGQPARILGTMARCPRATRCAHTPAQPPVLGPPRLRATAPSHPADPHNARSLFLLLNASVSSPGNLLSSHCHIPPSSVKDLFIVLRFTLQRQLPDTKFFSNLLRNNQPNPESRLRTNFRVSS